MKVNVTASGMGVKYVALNIHLAFKMPSSGSVKNEVLKYGT